MKQKNNVANSHEGTRKPKKCGKPSGGHGNTQWVGPRHTRPLPPRLSARPPASQSARPPDCLHRVIGEGALGYGFRNLFFCLASAMQMAVFLCFLFFPSLPQCRFLASGTTRTRSGPNTCAHGSYFRQNPSPENRYRGRFLLFVLHNRTPKRPLPKTPFSFHNYDKSSGS